MSARRGFPPAARREQTPPRGGWRAHRGWICAIAGSVLAGLVLGFGPTLALFSHTADSVAIGPFTAGNIGVSIDPNYNWTLVTPPNDTIGYKGESISGGPADTGLIANAWVTDGPNADGTNNEGTTLTIDYTGTITVTGNNMLVQVNADSIITGTVQANASASITTGLGLTDSSGNSLDTSQSLSPGTYSFLLEAFVFDTTFVKAVRFGSNSSDWTFQIGYPQITLTQVRS
ncbi:MAG: hypothetical protein FWF75_02495 [Propionibacteriaceae bacterium]|nr:hypothetical protein [Propionibacteriaceae bacterium]